jgi:hypothetical protein
MQSQGAAVLEDDVAELANGTPCFTSEHWQRHVTDELCRPRPRAIGTVGLGHLVIEGFVGAGGAPEGMEGAVEIGNGLDVLAGTGGRQREAQAQRGDDALALAKPNVLGAGVQQRLGKDPLAFVSNQSKLSVIHRGLLSWSPKPHTQLEFRMDLHKNPQQNQMLKSTYL